MLSVLWCNVCEVFCLVVCHINDHKFIVLLETHDDLSNDRLVFREFAKRLILCVYKHNDLIVALFMNHMHVHCRQLGYTVQLEICRKAVCIIIFHMANFLYENIKKNIFFSHTVGCKTSAYIILTLCNVYVQVSNIL